MKRFFFLLVCTALVTTGCTQTNHTADDWQSDLRFLQQTVHKDYSFLFKNITAEQFNVEVEKLYKAMPSLQEHERLAGLGRLVALFKYGHTSIGWLNAPIKYHVAPLNLYWFSDGVRSEEHTSELQSRLHLV